MKNSRFVAEAFPVSTPDEAKALWHSQKERYDNGGHIVYAFIVGPQGNIMGCSDDGEPSGTAGRPMLAVLKGSGITNIIITAARWFGGTKLGTGGLVRAYSDCAKIALEGAVTAELVPMTTLHIVIPYSSYDLIKRHLAARDFAIESEDFTTQITICGRLREETAPQLRQELSEMTGGRALITEG